VGVPNGSVGVIVLGLVCGSVAVTVVVAVVVIVAVGKIGVVAVTIGLCFFWLKGDVVKLRKIDWPATK